MTAAAAAGIVIPICCKLFLAFLLLTMLVCFVTMLFSLLRLFRFSVLLMFLVEEEAEVTEFGFSVSEIRFPKSV